MLDKPLAELIKNKPEPESDIAICSECGWEGPVSECQTDQEGDWESGYYTIHLCPKCEDGGCIDDYDMTPECLKEWEKWNAENNNKQYIGIRCPACGKINKPDQILCSECGTNLEFC